MDLRRLGKHVLLLTLILVILLNFLPVNMQVRLFLGSFGFGSGFVLLSIGKSKKYDL